MRRRLRRHAHWGAILALFTSGFVAYKQTPTLVPRPAPVALASPLPPASSPVQDEPPLAAKAATCDPAFLTHTYGQDRQPPRLAVLQACVTVTGTVVFVRHEADGDAHIGFKLDPGQEAFMSAANLDATNKITRGNFIIEVACVEGPVTQGDAQAACQGAQPPPGMELVVVGAHLRVTGPWINDTSHGHNEIHPVESVAANP